MTMKQIDPRERRKDERRKVERREAKKGVTVRHDDKEGNEPRRIRWAKLESK